MGCKCMKKIKRERDRVRSLAIRFAGMIRADVRFFSYAESGEETLYDFEPAAIPKTRGEELEIIKYQP